MNFITQLVDIKYPLHSNHTELEKVINDRVKTAFQAGVSWSLRQIPDTLQKLWLEESANDLEDVKLGQDQ